MMQTLNSNNDKDKMIDILIPINFDLTTTNYVNFPNGMVLLDILINFAKSLYKCYFKIVILFLVNDEKKKMIDVFFKNLKDHYDYYDIEIKSVDLLSFLKDFKSLNKINIINNQSYIESNNNNFENFQEYLSLIKNSSTKEDLLFNIQWNVIKMFSTVYEYKTVLLSNSMGNLATKILSNIVKGKGIEVSQILDQDQFMIKENGEKYQFQTLYPLKDVLNTEIYHYVKLSNLQEILPQNGDTSLDLLKNSKVVNIKLATINQLISSYFIDLEKNGYSTIVSTVVSTGSKLATKQNFDKNCLLCGFKINDTASASDWLDNITVLTSCDDDVVVKNEKKGKLLKDVCYGCLLSFSNLDDEDQFAWPVHDKLLIKNNDKEILDEYMLSDDE